MTTLGKPLVDWWEYWREKKAQLRKKNIFVRLKSVLISVGWAVLSILSIAAIILFLIWYARW